MTNRDFAHQESDGKPLSHGSMTRSVTKAVLLFCSAVLAIAQSHSTGEGSSGQRSCDQQQLLHPTLLPSLQCQKVIPIHVNNIYRTRACAFRLACCAETAQMTISLPDELKKAHTFKSLPDVLGQPQTCLTSSSSLRIFRLT